MLRRNRCGCVHRCCRFDEVNDDDHDIVFEA